MRNESGRKGAEEIASAAQVACIIEASCEKPGNVTPTKGFSDVDYNDYILGSLALRSSFLEAARRGYSVVEEKTSFSEIGIGELIEKGVLDVKCAHGSGNTHLGILLLMIPLSAAAGICLAQKKGFVSLRDEVIKVVASSTKKDSERFFSAIKASEAGGLGVLNEKDISFFELMKESAEKDMLAEELSGGMPILFEAGLPYFEECFASQGSVGAALLNTYLFILSRHPDTLIAKKAGKKSAEKVSSDAAKVLEGGLSLEDFDRGLREKQNLLNPGTTADLVCAVLFLWLLKEKAL